MRALFSGGGTVLAPLILLLALVALLPSSASLDLLAREPQALMWFGFALLSVFLLLIARLPAAERVATIAPRASPGESC